VPQFCNESGPVRHAVGTASQVEIAAHLLRCDRQFVPPLSDRVEIQAYAEKIREKAETFEAWHDDRLVGLIAAYLNDMGARLGYITSVSVDPCFRGLGLADALMNRCIFRARERALKVIVLEVNEGNAQALTLYRKWGFRRVETVHGITKMVLDLQPRD